MLTLQQLARALGGDVSGSQILAPGPGHSAKDRSLSIRLEESAPGGFLVHSFSGDDPILCKNYVRDKLRLPLQAGASNARFKKPAKSGATKGSKPALTIWDATTPANGTLITTYFAGRGLYVSAPPTIRFHPGLKHPTGDRWPAMVALVTRGVDDEPLAIHRTFLAPDRSAKAPVDPQKMMLGPCRGGAVRLAPAGDLLMVGEGIETCLAAMQATGHPAWAALSTSGLAALDLPDFVREVIVLADGDAAGEAAAHKAAVRWKREGRRVRIAHPTKGMDFNDMLMVRAPSIGDGCNG
jgi:putative DNA primase/helicase